MNNEAATSLAKLRVQDDTKVLKKCFRDFHHLLQPKLGPDELESSYEQLLIGVEQLSQHLAKAERVRNLTVVEVAGYEQEVEVLDTKAEETRRKIAGLRHRLQEAENDRAKWIHYDSIAKTIRKLPDRSKVTESNIRLRQDIAQLHSEEAIYAETWAQRQASFDAIVSALSVMSEAIRHEKMEQDRRKALEEHDEDENGSGALIEEQDVLGSTRRLNPLAVPFNANAVNDGEKN